MREYLLQISGAVMLASVLAETVPAENQRWVRLAAGLVIWGVVLSPVGKLPSIDAETKPFPKMTQNQYLMDEVERKLSEETTGEIYEKTGERVKVSVLAETDAEGRITGILCVELAPYTKESAAVAEKFLSVPSEKVVEG